MKVPHKLRWIGQALLLAAVFVAVLEVCARIEDAAKWGAPLAGPYGFETLLVSDSQGLHVRPGASFEKFRINPQGFRGPEVSARKPDGVVRVAVVGASETFGLYESPGKEFPAQIQAVLDAHAPGRYQVLNAAFAGMSPPRIREYFLRHVRAFQPDIVLFYPTPAFYLDDAPPKEKAPGPRAERRRPSLRIVRKGTPIIKSFVPVSIQLRLRRLLLPSADHPGTGAVWQEPPPERLELFRRHVLDLIDTVEAQGCRVLLATHATRFGDRLTPEDEYHLAAWRRSYPRASDHCLLTMEAQANELVRRMGKERAAPVVEVHAAVPKSADCFADFSHFTDKGAALAAKAFAREILAADPPPTSRAASATLNR